MKILIITDMYPHPAHQLSGIFIYRLVERLRHLGNEFRIIYTVPRPPFPLLYFGKWKHQERMFPKEYSQNGIKVSFPRYPYSYKLLPPSYYGHALYYGAGTISKRIIREFQPDIIWCQSALPNGWMAMKLSNLFNIPYVIVVHGADMNATVHLHGAKKRIAEVYRQAGKVIAVSGHLKRKINSYFKNVACRTIYQGYDPLLIEKAAKFKKSKKNQTEKITVVSICKLIKSKGVEYNILALKRLAGRYPNLKYKIIGDGEDRSRLEKMASDLNLRDRIEFTGRMKSEDAYEEIARADIYSMPSYKEGLGIVYLESMAIGAPVIGCEGVGICDLVNNGINGFLAPPKNVEALAEIWEKLILNPDLRQKIGHAGQLTVSENFTWDKIAAEYDKTFREILQNHQ